MRWPPDRDAVAMGPWLGPALVALLICWAFDLAGPKSLPVLVPLLGLTLFGSVLVAWIFVVEGMNADMARHGETEESDL